MIEFLSNFFKVAAAMVQAGKWPLVLLALIAGITVYGKIHLDGEISRVDRTVAENKVSTVEKISQVEQTNVRMVSAIRSVNKSLKDLNENLKEVKETVKTVDETNRDTQKMVIDIYKNQAGG